MTDQRKRILILGASRYYQKSIEAARRMGHRVLVTDRNPHAEGFRFADAFAAIDITDREATLSYAQENNIDAVIPINDFGVPTAAYVADRLNLPGLTPKQADILTDKSRMRALWNQCPELVVQSYPTRTLDEAIHAAETVNQWPIILKPADSRGGGSRGVVVVDSFRELQKQYAYSQSFFPTKPVMVEECISGTEHSLEVIVWNAKPSILAVSKKIKTPLPTRVDKSVLYPAELTRQQYACIQDCVHRAVSMLEIQNAVLHVELCYTSAGPRVFEIGGRCGGGGTPDPIMPFVTGVNLFQEQIRIALGEEPHHREPLYFKGATYHFLTPRPGIILSISGVQEVAQWDNVLDVDVLLQPGDEVRNVQTGGDRSGYIITGGENQAMAYTLALQAENHIRIQTTRITAATS